MAEKINVGPEKKAFPRIHIDMCFLQKNGVQIGQIWPLWPHQYFTPGYRGSPPCTLSQHPDTRETGYSNVLANSQTMEPITWPIKTSLLHHPARTQSDIGNIHKTNYQTWQKHDCTVLVSFILEGVFNMHIATLLSLCAMCRCAQCLDIYSDKVFKSGVMRTGLIVLLVVLLVWHWIQVLVSWLIVLEFEYLPNCITIPSTTSMTLTTIASITAHWITLPTAIMLLHNAEVSRTLLNKNWSSFKHALKDGVNFQ